MLLVVVTFSTIRHLRKLAGSGNLGFDTLWFCVFAAFRDYAAH